MRAISETFRARVTAKKVKSGDREYEYLAIHIPSGVARRLGLKKGDVVEIHMVKLSTGGTPGEEGSSASCRRAT